MKDKRDFYQILNELEGKDYTEYTRLVGDYDFSRFVVRITRVPRHETDEKVVIVLRVPQTIAGFPAYVYSTPIRRTALEDLLTRKLASSLDDLARFNEDGVAVRRVHLPAPGQKILPRSAMQVSEDIIEARVEVRFPIRRGRIASEGLADTFFADLPELVNRSLLYCNLDPAEIDTAVFLMEDADQAREQLPTRGMVAFLAEGSMLGREGGADTPDYEQEQALEVDGPLVTDMAVPNAGSLRGLGILHGITLILGDDASGRNDLTRAIAAGVYNHVPGDGREYIVTVPDAVYIAADTGRSVQQVHVQPFAPSTGAGGGRYVSDHAGAGLSQAASMMEAIEAGARLLLFDEQDSYPGFLAEDSRIAGLREAGSAPSRVPLAARARRMVDDLGISFVVSGNTVAAEWIPVADTVLRIDRCRVTDITEQAKAAIGSLPELPAPEVDWAAVMERQRWIIPSSIDPSVGRVESRIEVLHDRVLQFGRYRLDLGRVLQLADGSQLETIGVILDYARRRYLDDMRPVHELLDLIDRDLSTEGLDCLSEDLRHDLARPRRYELCAALNRLPSLRIMRVEG